MNKRQMKKKQKKYLPIIADESNLMTMTDSEKNKADEDFNKFRERYAFRKKYNDMKELWNVGRKAGKGHTVTQSIDDFK
jgi:hypothetical protein